MRLNRTSGQWPIATASATVVAVSALLETVIEGHGGLERWGQLDAVSARLVQGGALWGLKGQQDVLDDVFVRAALHQERESHHPFGAPDRRSVFTPERVELSRLKRERSPAW
jgi:hypothetical protein